MGGGSSRIPNCAMMSTTASSARPPPSSPPSCRGERSGVSVETGPIHDRLRADRVEKVLLRIARVGPEVCLHKSPHALRSGAALWEVELTQGFHHPDVHRERA